MYSDFAFDKFKHKQKKPAQNNGYIVLKFWFKLSSPDIHNPKKIVIANKDEINPKFENNV